MPVMKPDNHGPAAKDAIVLDLGDVSRQAEKIRVAAEDRAKQVLADAERQAKQLTENAEAQGYNAGYAQGVEAGKAEGRQQGHDAALAESGEQLQQLQQAWVQLATDLDAQRAAMDRDAREAIISFAVRAAEKLVHRTIEVDPSLVVDQLGHALAHVLGPHEVTVRIHPDDEPALTEALPELRQRFTELSHIHLTPDEQITPGGCHLSFGEGAVDATIEKQLQRVTDLILPRETEVDSNSSTIVSSTPQVSAQPDPAQAVAPEPNQAAADPSIDDASGLDNRTPNPPTE